MAADFLTTFSNAFIEIKIYKFRFIFHSPRFVSKDPINNIPALVQIMPWRRPGDKPLFKTMMVSLLTHRHPASMTNWQTYCRWVLDAFSRTKMVVFRYTLTKVCFQEFYWVRVKIDIVLAGISMLSNHATGHCMNWRKPRYQIPYGVLRPEWVNRHVISFDWNSRSISQHRCITYPYIFSIPVVIWQPTYLGHIGFNYSSNVPRQRLHIYTNVLSSMRNAINSGAYNCFTPNPRHSATEYICMHYNTTLLHAAHQEDITLGRN